MANRFRTNVLVLGNQEVTATGDSLYVNGMLISGGGGDTSLLEANLEITGSTLDNKINSLSGYSNNTFYSNSNPANYAQSGNFVSGISISGGLSIRNAFNINAGNNITLTQQGDNTLSIASTAAGGGGGVTGISVTGAIGYTGLINISGNGTLSIYTGINNLILFSGDTDYSPNNLGYLFFDNNMGQVAAFDANITGGQVSGTVNSYAFNVNGETIATVYSEYHSSTLPVRNASFNIHKNIGLNITGTTGGAFNFDDVPYYFHEGNIPSTGKLPSLASCTGRMYIIKCRGTGVLLTGFSSSEYIFNTAPAQTFLINSGESYHIVNGGNFWDII